MVELKAIESDAIEMKQQSVFGREFIFCQRDSSIDYHTWLLVFLSLPMYPLSAILNTNT
jgi:hypothetical protein